MTSLGMGSGVSAGMIDMLTGMNVGMRIGRHIMGELRLVARGQLIRCRIL